MTKFRLNGKTVEAKSPENARLLDVLRNELSITGVKCGCREGECGACSVLLDGKLTNSCLVALGSIDDCDVTTIEGFRETEQFKLLDRAFAAVSAVQCGFCIPGMVLAAHCILTKNPNPTDEEIREGISGNICRCTGYNAIVEAINYAAKENENLGARVW